MRAYLKTTLQIGLGQVEEIVARGGTTAEIAAVLDGMRLHDRRERFRLLGRTVERSNRQMMELLEEDGHGRTGTGN